MPVDPRLFRPFSLAEAYQAGDVHQARQQAIAATGAQQAAMGAQPGGLQGYYGQQISQQQQDRQMKMFKDLGGHKSKTAVDWYNKQGMAQEFGPITYEEPEAKKVEQGIDLGTLAASKQFQEELTPEQQAEVGIPAAQKKLFAAGGAPGLKLLGGTTAGTDPAQLRVFEATTGFTSEQQGTPEYIAGYAKYRQAQYGKQRVLGKTPGGDPIVFNSKTGEMEVVKSPGTGSILPTQDKLLSEKTIGEIAITDSLAEGLTHIRQLAATNPQYLGPIQGRFNKARALFFEDQEFTTLDREVESLITMAYMLSGKQISVQEMKMLKRAILPAITQPDANFMAALDHASTWLTRNRKNKVQSLKAQKYYVSPELEQGPAGAVAEPQGAASPGAQILVNPTTGERLTLKEGKWQPVTP